MATKYNIKKFLETVEKTFIERHAKYGSKGMDLKKAIALARTKLDRIENGAMEDSTVDLAGYALILHLLNEGTWDEQDNTMLPAKKRVLVKKAHPDGGIHRPKKTGDQGYDLVVKETTVVPPGPGKAMTVPAGVHIKIPDGYWCQILGRSSSANKKGLLVHTAVIDTGYTGEMFACVWNMTGEPIIVEKGERLAQVVFFPEQHFDFEEVDQLPTTERGETGFGSTGK